MRGCDGKGKDTWWCEQIPVPLRSTATKKYCQRHRSPYRKIPGFLSNKQATALRLVSGKITKKALVDNAQVLQNYLTDEAPDRVDIKLYIKPYIKSYNTVGVANRRR